MTINVFRTGRAWAFTVGASLALAATGPSQARNADDGNRQAQQWLVESATTDRLIIKYRSGGSPLVQRSQAAVMVAANRQGVRLETLRQMASGAHVLRINRAMRHDEVDTLAASLKAGDSSIDYVEPDRLLQPQMVVNDPMFAQQWALADATAGIRAPAAWDKSTGSGVVVAVIDTGIRPHADLSGRLLPGYDFVTDTKVSNDGNARDSDPSDPGDAVSAGFCGSGSPASNSSWHGTHVAGIVAAAANNGQGVAGVAFGAKVLPLRALGRCGGYTSDIADAIIWAAGGSVAGVPANANPARVINLSLGARGSCGQTTQNAISSARALGAVVVVAAGNDNTSATGATPANCAGVIAVTATSKSGGRASYANTGANVALAAPGGDNGAAILSTLNAGKTAPGADSYASYMGTSMATPVVSGVAALMLSANQNLTPDQVASMLKSSARAFPTACSSCGAGLVDAQAAVNLALGGSSTPAPTPTPTPTPTPAPTTPLAVSDAEPNNALGSAQSVASLPANVTGSIASSSDEDWFKLSVPAGAKFTATLAMGSASGFGLGVYSATGQQLLMMAGSNGRQQVVTITNSGSAAAVLVLRVLRSTGAVGNYTLALAK